MVKKDLLVFERLDSRALLSSVPWYIESIHADQVWGNIPASGVNNKPVVAIIDSGLDFNHDDLKNDIWTNPLEIAGNNKDDDGNGYIDDVHGWDFVSFDNLPQDGYYHGTHVSGIISTVSNHSVSLLPLKFISDSGSGYVGSAIAAINYAVNLKLKGINIAAINCSFGGGSSVPSTLSDALKRASDNNIVTVFASGNNGTNLDVTPLYPGSFNFSNSITVGSINPDNSLAGYSNYGKNTVTVVAPGTSIYSTLPGNNSYGYVSGTSMSAAVVSGEVGLLKTLGNYSASQIKSAILQGCDMISTLVDKVGVGLINVLKSWNLLKTMTPQKPVVVSPPPTVATPPVSKISYGLFTVNRNVISGWATISNSSTRPVVDVYINGTLRYSVTAQTYRTATKTADGFSIQLNKKFLYSYKKNLIEIRIRSSSGSVSLIAYKNYI